MSADDDLAATEELPGVAEKCCASCRVAATDDIQLKPCPKCDVVEYCSDKCQQDHLKEHEDACKERAAELYDELLFKQPESSHRGDCPICFLPMPIHANKFRIKPCCGQLICLGCIHADNVARRFKESRCPFCRHLTPETDEEYEKLCIERAKLNDLSALQFLGFDYNERGDYERAFHYWSKAAALGDAASMYDLSIMYRKGEGVEDDSDKVKALLEKAAIAGHPDARHNLGCFEGRNGRLDRAVAHWIIAANLGKEISIKNLKECYKHGDISKEDYAAALHAYQDAVDAMKSPQREAAGVYYGYID